MGALLAKDEVEVFPENWAAFIFFRNLGTQWRTNMGGAYGLDYNVVLSLIDRMDLTREEGNALFEDVRHMEGAALEVMREQQD